jgi:hypothetical protein
MKSTETSLVTPGGDSALSSRTMSLYTEFLVSNVPLDNFVTLDVRNTLPLSVKIT